MWSFFSGAEAISNGLRQQGLYVVSYDIKKGPMFDINSTAGFVLALLLTLRVKPGGFVWFAPLCSSWVWMCRNTTGRTPVFPEGRFLVPSVRYGNVMCARVLLLLWIAECRGVFIGLEQPTSSVMEHVPKFQDMLKCRRRSLGPLWRVRLSLGYYGAESSKPVFVYSNFKWVEQVSEYTTRVQLPKSEGVVTRTVNMDGRLQVSGGRNLKETENYPKHFGTAVARVYMANLHAVRERAASFDIGGDVDIEELFSKTPEDRWAEAKLGPVFDMLSRMRISE